MARARYCVSIAGGRDEFVYTFYCFSPAFFLARNPTHEEKLAFANQLVTRFKPRALSMKSFGCVKCGRQGMQPTFAGCQHPLLAEWDHKRNALRGNHPEKIKLRSNKQIFWLCTKCPAGQEHSWFAQPFSRTSRSKPGCPVCAGQAACKCNPLQALYCDIAAEWDHDRNTGQPCDYPAHSHDLVWWCSSQRGSWQQALHYLTSRVQQWAARLKRVQQIRQVELELELQWLCLVRHKDLPGVRPRLGQEHPQQARV
ncbi:hypothetical protein ABBQ38_008228 [Trebouxia sp. C0009 RCD-2024]